MRRAEGGESLVATPPRLSDNPNASGSYEIRWSECRGGVWRSKVQNTKTGERAEAEEALRRFIRPRPRRSATSLGTMRSLAALYVKATRDHNTRRLLRGPLLAFGHRDIGDPPSAAETEAYVANRAGGTYASPGLRRCSEVDAAAEVQALHAALVWDRQGRPKLVQPPAVTLKAPAKGVAPPLDLGLSALRPLWRRISPQDRAQHPCLRSNVWIDRNGPMAAISEQDGQFVLDHTRGAVAFPSLDLAEAFAAGTLFEREGLG